MEFNYEFDCPQYYYDLSKHSRDSNNFRSVPMIIDESKPESVIDDWFLVPHEDPPKAPSDELFFAELEKRDEMNQRKSKPFTENSTSHHSRLSTQQADNKRKRSISERSVTPSKQREALTSTTTLTTASHGGLGSKPLRNKSLLSNPVSNNGLKRGVSPGRSITANRDQENIPQNNVSTNLLQTGAQKISFNEDSKGFNKDRDGLEQPEKRRKTSTISSGAARNITTPSNSSTTTTLTAPASSASIQTRSKTSQLSKPAQSLASSTNKVTKPSSSVTSKTTRSASSRTSALGKAKTNSTTTSMIEDKSIEEMLKEHNAKFTPIPVYEPLKHSFRDVRKWEKLNGKLWNDLRPEEREKVNQEITMLKNANLL